MADTKVSALTALAAADAAAGDLAYVVDVSAGTSGSKKMLMSEVLDAALRVADSGDVLGLDATNGKLVVRQRGGTPGTDEVQISHDGTNAVINAVQGFTNLLGTDNIFTKPVLVFGTPGANAPSVIGNSAANSFQLYNSTGTTASALDCGSITSTGSVLAAAVSYLGWVGRSVIASPADGLISITASSGTAGATLRSIPLSPSQITANQNNYDPGTAHTYLLSSDASRDITGLAAAPYDGRWARIFNIGSNTITLKHQDVASSASNRFLNVTGSDIVLLANEGAGLEWEGTTGVWRVWKL